MPTSNDRIKKAIADAMGLDPRVDVAVEGLGDELGPYTITVGNKTVKTVKTLAEVIAELKK